MFLLYCHMLCFFMSSFWRTVSTTWYDKPAIKLALSIKRKIICKFLNNRLIRRKFLLTSAEYPNIWLFLHFHPSVTWCNLPTWGRFGVKAFICTRAARLEFWAFLRKPNIQFIIHNIQLFLSRWELRDICISVWRRFLDSLNYLSHT